MAAPQPARATPTSLVNTKLSKSPGRIGMAIFGVVVLLGLVYIGLQLTSDL